MEEKRQARNKPTLTQPINLQHKRQEYTMEKRVFLICGAGKLDSYVQKNELDYFLTPYTQRNTK